MATPVFVHIDDALVSIAATGAIFAAICVLAAGVALGLRATGIGGTFVVAWLVGVLVSVVSIAVHTWWPLAIAVGSVTLALTAGGAAHLARRFVQRPRYRRMSATTGP